MSDLVQALKAEHANIGKLLAVVSEFGADSEKGHKAIMAAKTGLLAHLEREDEHLYPVLEEAAMQDPILRDALDFFLDDIQGVAVAALAFFDKYEGGVAGDSFSEDFAGLAGVLTQRIQKEESVIYKMYDQIDQ